MKSVANTDASNVVDIKGVVVALTDVFSCNLFTGITLSLSDIRVKFSPLMAKPALVLGSVRRVNNSIVARREKPQQKQWVG